MHFVPCDGDSVRYKMVHSTATHLYWAVFEAGSTAPCSELHRTGHDGIVDTHSGPAQLQPVKPKLYCVVWVPINSGIAKMYTTHNLENAVAFQAERANHQAEMLTFDL